jgi:hypothetical protein
MKDSCYGKYTENLISIILRITVLKLHYNIITEIYLYNLHSEISLSQMQYKLGGKKMKTGKSKHKWLISCKSELLQTYKYLKKYWKISHMFL